MAGHHQCIYIYALTTLLFPLTHVSPVSSSLAKNELSVSTKAGQGTPRVQQVNECKCFIFCYDEAAPIKWQFDSRQQYSCISLWAKFPQLALNKQLV